MIASVAENSQVCDEHIILLDYYPICGQSPFFVLIYRTVSLHFKPILLKQVKRGSLL